MTRFKQRAEPATYIAIVLATLAVFIFDLLTPLGYAVWIFYLIPVVLAFFMWRPAAPAFIALIVTCLTVIGFFASPAGLATPVARVNRLFGLLTFWTLAGIGYQFIHNKLVVRREEWLQLGQSQLSETMAGDPEVVELCERVLRFLAVYLDAPAGVMFVCEGGPLQRMSTYGVPLAAPMPKTVAPGDGLLGRVLQDRKALAIDKVPEGYFTIGSALGQITPRHLLIAPFVVDNKTYGVLELGFLQSPGQAGLELMRRVSESVAVALRSAQYRNRLQELLEETQRQAEELQAQSEELRVNNEELEEQSRALKESQVRLESQQAELEQTNSQLEEQTQILERQKDELTRSKDLLEQRGRELEQASRYKSEFLANMSHELRTPLNSSLILARLLAENREGNLLAEQIKYAKTIEAAGNDLLALINDVLDLAKVESGRLELHIESVILPRLLDSLRATFQPLAQEKGLKLILNCQPDAPQQLRTDGQRLEQVLRNLLSNALKFTDHGEVELKVTRSGNRVDFSVRDTGIGIGTDQQRLIFEPFCQADGNTNRKYGGTGLGLSISRELVSLLGGEIHLTSNVGQGSTFTVSLPENYSGLEARPSARLAERPAAAAPQPQVAVEPAVVNVLSQQFPDDRGALEGNGRVLLIVEDDESFARVLYDLAHELHFKALVATSVAEAQALATQYLPAAVLLDLGLPDNSGLLLLERLKKDNRTRHIPVHVISGSDYTQTALSMGAVGYMLKPVKREQLVEALRQLEIRATKQLRRLLIVEDDPVQLESLRKLLGSPDVETTGAATAAECLEKLASATYDCMVLDLRLPDASGFALLETLSHNDAYSFPPVIVYTGSDVTAAEEQRLRNYAKSIIIKGAKSPERLLDEVTLFLHQVVSELPSEQQKLLEKARGRDEALEGRRILLAEDDVRNVFAVTSVLEPRGAILEVARNGREALNALKASLEPGGSRIDLVLMDLMMPEMDGLTAIRAIRAQPEFRKLPIIAVTAKAMKTDQEQTLAAGANDYISKPLDVEKLLSLVRVWMPR